MVMVNTHIRMDSAISVSSKMIRRMVVANTSGPTEKNMMDTGKMVSKTVTVGSQMLKKAPKNKAYGKMESG